MIPCGQWIRLTRVLCLSAAVLGVVSGCSSAGSPPPAVPYLRDVTDAPAAIQAAAHAVVRIEIGTELATGSFISPNGLFLTNNHVVGVDLCPTEGCYAKLTWDYQRHSPKQDPQTVYAVPRAVDVGLDMAIVEIEGDGPGSAPIASPDYLTIDSHDAPSLLGMHVNVVGHPQGALKKWTSGQAVTTDGTWVWTTAFVLPGSSGSPILDDHGHLVGLIHRGPEMPDLLTTNAVNEYSVGTASAALIGAMSAPLPSAMWSISAQASEADVVAHDRIYLTAHSSEAHVGGSTKPVVTILGSACDAALARNDYASPDDLSSGLTPCTDAEAWIECNTPPSGVPPSFTYCPDVPDASVWLGRFHSVFERWRVFNGQLSLDEVSFAVAALSSSATLGQSDAATSLSQALGEANAPLDPDVAEHLAAFDLLTYAGKDIVDYVRHYASIADYPLSGEAIVETALWLNHDGVMSGDETDSLLQTLYSDGSVDVGTKLLVEQIRYDSGTLQ